MSNFNTMLIDIATNNNHCFIIGNNRIANNDVFEYMVSLVDDSEYEMFDLFEKENTPISFVTQLLNQTFKGETKRVIASIKANDFNEFSNIFKEKFFDTYEKQGFYVIDIHETSQNEDIYIRIYKLENNILKQLDLKGNC